MQAKLLRVLQNGEIEKLGRQKNIPVDVRIIAATNQPLEEMIKSGKFRSDLYYRLNVVSIKIPPLRQRGNDIILLANYFCSVYCKKYGKNIKLSQAVYQIFMKYDWPGNVRQLQNVIESATVLCGGDTIEPEDLPEYVRSEETAARGGEIKEVAGEKGYAHLQDELERVEKEIIKQTICRCSGNKSQAMEVLGVARRTFYRKLKYYGIK